MTTECKSCGDKFEFDPEFVICDMVPLLCEHCVGAENAIRIAKRKHEIARRRWLELCPEMFRDTEREKLPRPIQSNQALEWKANNCKGLNLFGRPGTGKTRTMYLVLEGLHYGGTRVGVMIPGEFVRKCEAKAFCRGPWLKYLRTVDVLAWDDFDKLSLTKDKESDLFSVLDYRMANRLPMIFTGNCDGDHLKLKFKNGEALVRRIRESCRSIYFA
jgi:hypothetical protein